MMKLLQAVFLTVLLHVTTPATAYGDGKSPQASPQYRFGQSRRVEGYYKGQITPHWLADNKGFWYRNDLSGNTKEFILVMGS